MAGHHELWAPGPKQHRAHRDMPGFLPSLQHSRAFPSCRFTITHSSSWSTVCSFLPHSAIRKAGANASIKCKVCPVQPPPPSARTSRVLLPQWGWEPQTPNRDNQADGLLLSPPALCRFAEPSWHQGAAEWEHIESIFPSTCTKSFVLSLHFSAKIFLLA